MREPNGLLAAGGDLSADRLIEAYHKGIFPWYSEGQPVLWWSPDPRMVLHLDEFKLSRSLTKTLRRLARGGDWTISHNRCFERVMRECSQPRDGQDGTWITDDIVAAYGQLHQRGLAHSVEVWSDGAVPYAEMKSLADVAIAVVQSKARPVVPSWTPIEQTHLIHKLLDQDPTKRPSSAEVHRQLMVNFSDDCPTANDDSEVDDNDEYIEAAEVA